MSLNTSARLKLPQLITCRVYSVLSRAETSLFCGSKTGNFIQEQPKLQNQYLIDPVLSIFLEKTLPTEIFDTVNKDLVRFGDYVVTNVQKHHDNVCLNEPVLVQYDGWGRRVDNIITHTSWQALHDIAAKEELISIPYENKYSEWSRIYQAAKLYLFSPSSGLYSCPLAMTDGAASILKSRSVEPFTSAYANLISNDPNLFWTSGQWMTEKQGGSDVGNSTETLAVKQKDGTFKLYGYKWFSSATDANMTLTLARIVDGDGYVKQGSKGLTMFYAETRLKNGDLNGIRIEKLKKKLGTRQMATGELILDGMISHQLSEDGRGIASISSMLNITRFHNAVSSISNMRRLLNLSRDFSKRRKAFGSFLCDLPLHVQTVARMEVEQHGGFFLTMKVASLLGLIENNKAGDYEKLLFRLLISLAKLYTGKQAVSVASEGLESFGGHGYLEDTGLPVFLRDAQVLSIWEGTTNILSLDVLRSISKTDGEVLKVFCKDGERMISQHHVNASLQETRTKLLSAFQRIKDFSQLASSKEESFFTLAARDFSFSLARFYIGCLLYEYAVNSCEEQVAIYVAHRWCFSQDLVPVFLGNQSCLYETFSSEVDQAIVYGKT